MNQAATFDQKGNVHPGPEPLFDSVEVKPIGRVHEVVNHSGFLLAQLLECLNSSHVLDVLEVETCQVNAEDWGSVVGGLVVSDDFVVAQNWAWHAWGIHQSVLDHGSAQSRRTIVLLGPSNHQVKFGPVDLLGKEVGSHVRDNRCVVWRC